MDNLLIGTEIDLTKGEGHNHPDIIIGEKYICKINNCWYMGTFDKQWYGLNFNGWLNHLQYDKPHTNASKWQRIIHCVIN